MNRTALLLALPSALLLGAPTARAQAPSYPNVVGVYEGRFRPKPASHRNTIFTTIKITSQTGDRFTATISNSLGLLDFPFSGAVSTDNRIMGAVFVWDDENRNGEVDEGEIYEMAFQGRIRRQGITGHWQDNTGVRKGSFKLTRAG